MLYKLILIVFVLYQVWRQTTGGGWTQFGECKTFNSSSNVETDREQSDIRSGVMAWDRAVNMCEFIKQSF
jgi:hypothetical protein